MPAIQDREYIVVISSYPPKNSLYGHALSAVASYTKNTLNSIKKQNKNIRFSVLADALENEKGNYKEEGMVVKRCWDRDSFFLFWNLLSQIKQMKESKKILFAFEWAMLGNSKLLLILLPLFLFLLKVMGKRVYFVTHAVLLDAKLVAAQIGIDTNSVKVRILSIALKVLYFFIVLLTYKVVVFEQALEDQLADLTGRRSKLVTIPHGVEIPGKVYESKKAKEKLGLGNDFIITSFGFHIWYKGTDWIASAMANFFRHNPKANIRLLLVGGPTKKYLKNPIYTQFLEKIDSAVKQSKGKIQVTGFVDEHDIPLYYCASDVLVFPYRVFVSSSGPLSLAFSYKKPVLLSKKLKPYFKTLDMKQSFEQNDLSGSDMIFNFNEESFVKMINQFSSKKAKLESFSYALRKSRSWDEIGKKYYLLLQN